MKRRNSLSGAHLYQHSNGHYYWRRKDPITGARTPVDVGTRLDRALERATELDLEFEARLEGRPTAAAWDLEVAPLVDRWLSVVRDKVRAKRTYQNKKMRIERVVRLLGLTQLRDLRRLAIIDDRLRGLISSQEASAQNVRCAYQEPLRQFSAWLAENNRILDVDPLANWKPIEFEHVYDARRSVLPLHFAGALVALDYMGHDHGYAVAQRPFYVTLLVTGARAGALTSRQVLHLDRRGSRIDLGKSVGKKRRGAAALDPTTLAEVIREADGRGSAEPLFRAPRGGGALDTHRAYDLWDQAMSLAIVDELWPDEAPRDLDVLHRVSRSLRAGAVRVGIEGNPRLVTRRRKKVDELRVLVGDLTERLRAEWKARREGIVLASIRKTHHTWARALGVPPPCIDKQLGHAAHEGDGLDVIHAVLGSRTGSRHYLDMRSSLIDPGRSALAVRERLDEAERELLADARSLLAGWARSSTPRTAATSVVATQADTTGA